MSEFDKQGDYPDLSMDLSPTEFNEVITHIADTHSDELAYGIYGSCLDEDPLGQEETEVGFKRGLLYKFMGEIEVQRGDYDDALASYRQARAEIIGLDELNSLELYGAEGHLLIHQMEDPRGSIEPYEHAIRIFENTFTGSESAIADHQLFNGYTGVLSHLAGAYSQTGDFEKVREVSSKLAALGHLTPAIYGFDSCDHHNPPVGALAGTIAQKPIYEEISAKLTGQLTGSKEEQAKGLRSLERLIDRDEFMPEAPEERDHILHMIYATYAQLLPNLNEQELYLNRALKIAKRHSFHVPLVSYYLSLGDNQAAKGLPMKKQQQSVKKALLASEASLDAGASMQLSRIAEVAGLLLGQMEVMNDYIGMEKTKRRLASRGIEAQKMPGTTHPELN